MIRAAALVLALSLAPGLVRAQPDLRSLARRHFSQGVALFESGDHEAALAEFEEAYRIAPAPRILQNVAATQEALRRYLDAIATLERFVTDARISAAERRAAEHHLRGLRALLARIEIHAEPPGAEIVVEGRIVGRAPLTEPVAVASGQVRLLVRAPGHRPAEREIRIAAGGLARESFRLAPLMARLHLQANARGARATIDGRTHELPADLELGSGRHSLRAGAPGRLAYATEIVLQPDETRTMTIVLDRPPARLRYDVAPPGARVWIDGRAPIVAGRGAVTLESGVRHVRIEGPGLVPWEDDVTLQDGGRHRLRARLGRDRFLHLSPAWFWAGAVATAGLAVAAAFVGVRVLLYDRQAKHPEDSGNTDYAELLESRDQLMGVTDALWVGTVAMGALTAFAFAFSRGEPPTPQVDFR